MKKKYITYSYWWPYSLKIGLFPNFEINIYWEKFLSNLLKIEKEIKR
jgi:hypothetical protein